VAHNAYVERVRVGEWRAAFAPPPGGLGAPALAALLCDTQVCLFQPLQNGCFVQVAGLPLSYDCLPPPGGAALDAAPAAAPPQRAQTARRLDVRGAWRLPRTPLLFSSTFGRHGPGLPASHVLHVLSGRRLERAASPLPLPLAQPCPRTRAAMALMHHIFFNAPHIAHLRALADCGDARGGGGGGGPRAARPPAASAAGLAAAMGRVQDSATARKLQRSTSVPARVSAPQPPQAAGEKRGRAGGAARTGGRSLSVGAVADGGLRATQCPRAPPPPRRMPPSLLPAVPLFEELLRRYAVLPFHSLLERHCRLPPLPPLCVAGGVGAGSGGGGGGGGAEAGCGAALSAPGGAVAGEAPAPSTSGCGGATNLPPRVPSPAAPLGIAMLPLAVPREAGVVSFVCACLRALLPAPLLGGARNERVLFRGVSALVGCAKGLPPRVGELLLGLRTTGFRAVFGGGAASAARARVWALWVFLALAVPLVRAHFYVTDSEVAQSRLLFFRKPTWGAVARHAWAELRGRLRLAPLPLPLPPARAADGRRWGLEGAFATVRFVPKARGLRPIMDLSTAHGGYPALGPRAGSGRGRKRSRAGANEAAAAHAVDDASGGHLPPTFVPRLGGGGGGGAGGGGGGSGGAAPRPPDRSINFNLTHVHDVLKCLRLAAPACAGGAVFGVDGAHRALRLFRAARYKAAGAPPTAPTQPPAARLHCATADVYNAYDSMDQAQVLNVVSNLLREEAYTIVAFFRASRAPEGGGVRLRRARRAFPGAAPPPFLAFAEAQLAGGSRGLVFAEAGVAPKVVEREALRRTLGEHVKNHWVFCPPGSGGGAGVGGQMARQQRGVPQGSILSSILCNLYFAAVEARVVLPRAAALLQPTAPPTAPAPTLSLSFPSPSNSATPAPAPAPRGVSLLMRLTDDFFVASESLPVATALATALHGDALDYGLRVNVAKTQTSFPFEAARGGGGLAAFAPAAPAPSGAPAPLRWCGLLLHPDTFRVNGCYGRYTGAGGVAGSVPRTLPGAGPTAAAFSRALRAYVRPKCTAVLLDGLLNDAATVARNVYEVAALAAAKGVVALRRRGAGRPLAPRAVLRAFLAAADYVAALVCARAPARSAAAAAAADAVALGSAPWWASPPFPPHGGGAVVLGARAVASLALGARALPLALAEGGDAGGDDAPPPRVLLTWCPLRRREVQWLALTAFSDVLVRAEAVAVGVAAALLRVRAAVREGALRCGGGVPLTAAGAGGEGGAALLRPGARVGAPLRVDAPPPTLRALRNARNRMRACREGVAGSPLLPLLRLDEGSREY
jgi:hypothetical protein